MANLSEKQVIKVKKKQMDKVHSLFSDMTVQYNEVKYHLSRESFDGCSCARIKLDYLINDVNALKLIIDQYLLMVDILNK